MADARRGAGNRLKPTKRKFRHESLEDSRSIARYFDALKEGFDSGAIRFADDQGEVVLAPHGLVRMELGVSYKRDRTRIKLELSWRDGEKREMGPLRISAPDGEESVTDEFDDSESDDESDDDGTED